jgi:hypothetical protein
MDLELKDLNDMERKFIQQPISIICFNSNLHNSLLSCNSQIYI